MKTKFVNSKLFINSLIIIMILSASIEIIAQEKNQLTLKDFKIVIEKTETGIKMQSLNGSAWTNLTFSINNDKPQAIDEYGMTDLGKVSTKKDSNLADFLFTITKTEAGIVLQGFEGTAWTNLSFTLTENAKQTINQFGMTEN